MNTNIRIVKIENAYILGVQDADQNVREYMAPDEKELYKLVKKYSKGLARPSEIVLSPLESPPDTEVLVQPEVTVETPLEPLPPPPQELPLPPLPPFDETPEEDEDL